MTPLEIIDWCAYKDKSWNINNHYKETKKGILSQEWKSSFHENFDRSRYLTMNRTEKEKKNVENTTESQIVIIL